MREDWLKNLKAGDRVILVGGSPYSPCSIQTVEKVTPTGRIKVKGMTFNQDGTQYGGDRYWSYSIGEATPKEVESIRHEQKVITVKKMMHDTKRITYEQAIAIEAILREKEATPCTQD